MNTVGFSAGFHDAAVSVVNSDGKILFASHSERYSKRKHDKDICFALASEIEQYGPVQTIAYYERPWYKKLRQLAAGQTVGLRNFTARSCAKNQFGNLAWLNKCRFQCFNHHLSHAAAGFQTSPYTHATVVVIDAIGEFETATIWAAEYDNQGHAKYTKLWQQNYPHSIGLFYSAVTKHIGLHPMDEEYITMGMAAWGNPNTWHDRMQSLIVEDYHKLKLKGNFHIGLPEDFLQYADHVDLAAAAQNITEQLIQHVMIKAKEFSWSDNLVYMGGVALNCMANRHLGKYFNNIWIMPAPGDAGSSLGAAALAIKKQIPWSNAFLGHEIAGDYPVDSVLQDLQNNHVVGVANGRAEFGPRALGNRSVLADPRGAKIKDRVNEIKRRQKFRPFAPAILEELVDDYFVMPLGFNHSRYMQVIADCRRPDLYPAICHVDGTSRVQTVPCDGSGIRRLLEAWYDRTGCPMLLNTSLNVRGEPMVNDQIDAERFKKLYNINVHC